MAKSVAKISRKPHVLHSSVKRSKRQHGKGEGQGIGLSDVQLEEAPEDTLNTIVNTVNKNLEALKAKREQIKNNINNLPESVKNNFLERFTQNIRPAIGGLLSKQISASMVQINNIKKKSYKSVNTAINDFIDQTLAPFEAEVEKAAKEAVQPAAAKQPNAAAQSNTSKSSIPWYKRLTSSKPRQKEMDVTIWWKGVLRLFTIKEDIECAKISEYLKANPNDVFIYKMNEKEEAKAKTNENLNKNRNYIAIVCYLDKDGKQINDPKTIDMLSRPGFYSWMRSGMMVDNREIGEIRSTFPSNPPSNPPPPSKGGKHRNSAVTKKRNIHSKQNCTHRK